MWHLHWTDKRGVVRPIDVEAPDSAQAMFLVFATHPAVSVSLPHPSPFDHKQEQRA